jgi:hypothetical protein
MLKYFKLSILLLPLVFTSCLKTGISGGGGGGFDIVRFLKNPIVMGIIIIIVLYFVFKSSSK